MIDHYTEEYLRIIREEIDPMAQVDVHGNVVYIDHDEYGCPEIITVSPQRAYEYLMEMSGGF